jgi:hypothetical protein
MQRVELGGHCLCGKSKFFVAGTPLGRFVCHCTICQGYTGEPFNDVAAFWAGSVCIPAEFPVTFKKYRPPPNVNRGLCQHCSKPVVEFMAIAPLVRLAFVPAGNIRDAQNLPPPSAHIFYDRRVKDVDDSIAKFSGYWPSELAVSRLIIRNLFR